MGFLEKMMAKLGFQKEFIDLLMACVSSVKYNVMRQSNLSLPGDSDRVTRYHHIYFGYVQKGYQVYWLMQRRFVA
jgi:hypothetical protein